MSLLHESPSRDTIFLAADSSATLQASTLDKETSSPQREPDFGRLLLAVDQSLPSQFAAEWARQVATTNHCRVWVLTVLSTYMGRDDQQPPFDGQQSVLDSPKYEEVLAWHELDRLVADMGRAGVEARPTLARGPVVEGIVSAANEIQADLIIVGSRGAGRWERFTVGSVSESIRRGTDASLLIAKAPYRRGPILAAADGSADGARVARVAQRLARRWRVPITLLHVSDGNGTAVSPSIVDGFQRNAGDAGVVEHRGGVKIALAVGPVADRILDAARATKASLIVMGSRGLTGVRALLAGSVSNKVVHEADVPILLVRGSDPWA